jgi:hypothetical protein
LRLIVQNRVVVHDEVLAHQGWRVTGFSHVCSKICVCACLLFVNELN